MARRLQAKALWEFIYRQVTITRTHTTVSGQKTPSTYRSQYPLTPEPFPARPLLEGPGVRQGQSQGHGRERAPLIVRYQRSPGVAPTPEEETALGPEEWTQRNMRTGCTLDAWRQKSQQQRLGAWRHCRAPPDLSGSWCPRPWLPIRQEAPLVCWWHS